MLQVTVSQQQFMKRVSKNAITLSLAIGLLIRIAFVLISLPLSNYDLESYRIVGSATFIGQSIYPDLALSRFPYIPLFLYFQAFAAFLGSFDIVFLKLVIIAFDTAIIYLLYRMTKKREVSLLYALCPVPIFVSGLHGQFDAIPLFFLLLTVLLLEKRHILWGGLSYSLAVAFKTWPIFFVVPLTISLSQRSRDRWFFLSLVPFVSIAAILFYGHFFQTPLRDIVFAIRTYQPVFGVFGTGLILKTVFERHDLYFIGMAEKLFLVALFVYSFWQRKKTVSEQVLSALLFLFVFTPVFGIQWFTWIVPFLLIIRPQGSSILLLLMSAFVLFSYLSWRNDHVLAVVQIMGVAAWLTFVCLFLNQIVPSSLRSKLPSFWKLIK